MGVVFGVSRCRVSRNNASVRWRGKERDVTLVLCEQIGNPTAIRWEPELAAAVEVGVKSVKIILREVGLEKTK